jgi:hypothetical protein
MTEAGSLGNDRKKDKQPQQYMRDWGVWTI